MQETMAAEIDALPDIEPKETVAGAAAAGEKSGGVDGAARKADCSGPTASNASLKRDSDSEKTEKEDVSENSNDEKGAVEETPPFAVDDAADVDIG